MLLHGALALVALLRFLPLCCHGAPTDGGGSAAERLRELRKLRNSKPVLRNLGSLYMVSESIEQAMVESYTEADAGTTCAAGEDGDAAACANATAALQRRAPGNFHGIKSHTYFVGAIAKAHPILAPDQVQSIVASEWYHPGLTAKPVWCTHDCGGQFPLAQRLDANYELIRREVDAFWRHPDAVKELKGVGSHTTQYDKMIAGNGTWIDVRLWRGRAFNKHLCERHFRVICGIVEQSKEVWTNPWSHVLLSVLLRDSWVPYHQGFTNGQLTYHFPVQVPKVSGAAELAVIPRGGALNEAEDKNRTMVSHPEEVTVTWREGQTLVFDDSFAHSVRVRATGQPPGSAPSKESPLPPTMQGEPRVILLMRGWHPELGQEERSALREFIRKGGEEETEGYEFMPITPSVFE